jgi:hypothetical protein
MSYWNGIEWEPQAAPSAAPSSRHSKARDWIATAVMIIGLVALLIPFGMAGAGRRDADCSISSARAEVGEEFWIDAWGLPTGTAINIWVTDRSGTVGRPLGSTSDGRFHMQEVSTVEGVTTFAFSGPVRGNGSMKVYARCSVDVY